MLRAAMTDSAPLNDPFGTQRSLEPKGSLPQPAQRVDNDFSRLYPGEMLIAVETLNVDAASFQARWKTRRGPVPR